MSIVKAYTSIIGDTGYNCHSRNFFKELDKLIPVQVRNFTIGSSWEGYNNDEPHNNEYYIDDQLKTMLVEQTLHTPNGRENFPLYTRYKNEGNPDVHLILNETNHYYFFENYNGLKIAYNVWETTRQPEQFFESLKKFDQIWVPSEWQRKCTIEQGISPDKIKVVPEGVDTETFKPKNRMISYPTGRPFKFLLIGRWDYRKCTKEIIETFTKTFSEDENVELILSADNPFPTDGMNSTEERLERYGITHSSIKVVHHLSKTDYVDMLKSGDVFLSCARGEGWNLPLIEAMSCGVPSIYSNWGAQLEFADGCGIPVNIVGEIPASSDDKDYYSWIKDAPGNFAEPDFNDLSMKMRDAYTNFKIYKKKALDDSDKIREKFTWKNAAILANDIIQELISENKSVSKEESIQEKSFKDDFAYVTCGNIGYMPIIEKMVKSLLEFSDRRVIVYGVNCDVPFDYPNMIKRRIDPVYYSEHDKWYWKQQSCIDSLNESFTNYIWIDGDIVANHNIDDLSVNFERITNYPIPDIHVQEEFFGYYKTSSGETKTQLFNEVVAKKYGVQKKGPVAHACLYAYNQECKWWFEEILKIYRETPIEEYAMLLQWNDEGIDNLLRYKYNCSEYLSPSKLDLDGRQISPETTIKKSMEYFLTFWNESGHKNFGQIYGWCYIPKDKSTIKYFHGNKYPEFAQFMIDFIKMRKDNTFHDNHWFYVGNHTIKNLGEIYGVEGSTLDIASKYGWDYAIYHEIYNLKDYERFGNVEIKKGDVVVDLGGNIGVFTRYAHQNDASKIITFEPDRRYFQLLRKNAPKNAILFNAAIGDKLGKMTLTESEHLGGSNLWTPSNSIYNQYDVQTYSLNYLFESKLVDRIDFLKVDIEGSEIIALNGISNENLLKVKNIAVEYHHEHLNFDEEIRDTFIRRLLNLGFNSHVLMCGTDGALQLIYFWK